MYNRLVLLFFVIVTAASCRKTEYTTIAEPAYLRVFNNLDYNITVDTKDVPQPFLTMLIDPELDADGVPVKAATVGDFLDKRAKWARPYPDAVSTVIYQTEYPGSAKVLAGPILNGYDLSSWAQVPSGKHRIMFYSRPFSTVPFFDLPKDLRKLVMIDTTVNFGQREVYTMHILEKKFSTKEAGIYIRQEDFVKRPFSDSMVYVNFYNLSSEGFSQNAVFKDKKYNQRLLDTMNVYSTLNYVNKFEGFSPIEGHKGNLMGRVIRSQSPEVQPYYSFPLFPDTIPNRIYTGRTGQVFTFLSPEYTYATNPFIQYMGESNGRFSELAVLPEKVIYESAYQMQADLLTGMVVTVRSGAYFNRSFSTVNTIEYVNGKFFLTTIQRKYEPPVY
ncbi:hypothetical protein [Chitinophaga solisilvae]|uniref:hypothetical protein n=1 Tax=Chitinophaga solisilvae TaxID=1233460 RepID=UPI00136AC9B6|nr:hypothetical protein [Chitinophaga solisilvae]